MVLAVYLCFCHCWCWYRYWVASTDYTRDVLLGPSVVSKVSDSVRKLRNVNRFLLGNLHGFPLAQHVDTSSSSINAVQGETWNADGVNDLVATAWGAPAGNGYLADLDNLTVVDRYGTH